MRRRSAWQIDYGKLAYGELAMGNWHMVKQFMAKHRIPIGT